MPKELDGKVAIVIGASRGTGKHFALALAAAGAKVTVAGRTNKPGRLPGTIQETAAEIEQGGGQALAIRCDVAVPADVQHLVGTTVHRLGSVDILVNNAAIAERMPFFNISPEWWDSYFAVNVKGPFFAAQAVVPHMMRHGAGSIVNITSGAATAPINDTMMAHHGMYAITKAALDRTTMWMAQELRPYNIAVNSLGPGPTITEGIVDRVPEHLRVASGLAWRPATVEYLGPPIVHLAQQDASGITGQVLPVDGFGKTWP